MEKGIGKSAITRNAAEDLQIPIYQAPKHQMPQGDFFVDFTDGYVKKKKPKKKVNDPISAAMKYRAGDQTNQAFKNDSAENQERILSKIKLEPHQEINTDFINFTDTKTKRSERSGSRTRSKAKPYVDAASWGFSMQRSASVKSLKASNSGRAFDPMRTSTASNLTSIKEILASQSKNPKTPKKSDSKI